MDVVLDVPRSQSQLSVSLCPGEVDLCGGDEQILPLCYGDLQVCSDGGESGAGEGGKGGCCLDGRVEGEPASDVFQHTEKRWRYELLKQTSQSMAKHIVAQAEQTERQIKQDFEELRRFLREEEEARIAALREEEQRKSSDVEEARDTLGQLKQALADTITDIEGELEKDDVSFLQNYETTIKRTWKDLKNPKKNINCLIEVPKHMGNLRFRVWKKMQCICPYTPVTVDPNTASCSLMVSDSLDAVNSSSTLDTAPYLPKPAELPPLVPERFHPYALGSETVSSSTDLHQWESKEGVSSTGLHQSHAEQTNSSYNLNQQDMEDTKSSSDLSQWDVKVGGSSAGLLQWDVEVGGSDNWTLGVCYASVRRWAEFEACPEEGLWTLSLRDGSLMAMTSPCQEVLMTSQSSPCQQDQGQRNQEQCDGEVLGTSSADHSSPSLEAGDRHQMSTSPPPTTPMSPSSLRVVRVMADWNGGQVTFRDAERDTHLFTFKHAFTEPLHPYFETICKDKALVVRPQRVYVNVEKLQPPDESLSL
ncbi:E3 ubiquitin-protein ligase TRIM39-like [Engraulis encrasicolus]|uniref:E3 ubiquitin-protein ligase TRIM39-like n=1 Tax=Engraulis encrasicolus TaxID=184585 RepID=UPI002FD6EA5A